MTLFRCPLCGGSLSEVPAGLRCPRGHSFDRAKEGYVNLLPVGQKHSKAPGDDKAMVAARHLWELKEVLYDQPYPNEERETPYQGFAYEQIVPVDYTVHLPNQETIQALFGMTPYAWKTPKAGKDRLAALEALDCRVSFHIHVFRRED